MCGIPQISSKNPNTDAGSTGSIKLAWVGEYTKFANLDIHRTGEY